MKLNWVFIAQPMGYEWYTSSNSGHILAELVAYLSCDLYLFYFIILGLKKMHEWASGGFIYI